LACPLQPAADIHDERLKGSIPVKIVGGIVTGRNMKPMEINAFIIPWPKTNTLACKIRIDDAGQNERPRREPS